MVPFFPWDKGQRYNFTQFLFLSLTVVCWLIGWFHLLDSSYSFFTKTQVPINWPLLVLHSEHGTAYYSPDSAFY